MAQNAPHGHQVDAAASDDGHSATPNTVAFPVTSACPHGNNGGSSAGNMENVDASAGKGKNLIPDRDSAGGSKDKPRSEAEVEVAAADADKGKKSVTAAHDDGEPNANIVLERETAQGMAALCASDVPRGWGGVPVPPAARAVSASPLRWKTWVWPNVTLSVANDIGYISVWAPRHANTLTMLMSVLDNHGMDVNTVQITYHRVSTQFMIYTHVTGIGGENRHSSEEVYQRAVLEIKNTLNNNNNNNNYYYYY